MARKPRAPVLRCNASSAISSNASSSNVNSTPSRDRIFSYCLVNAFFGFVRIWTNASRSNRSNVTITGKRPINSGIKPNFNKSSGTTSLRIADTSRSSARCTSAPKPNVFLAVRFVITLSIPSNAPPQIKRILVVSICNIS